LYYQEKKEEEVSMAFDRYERAESIERTKERVKTITDFLEQWSACVDAAIARAKTSLIELRRNKNLIESKT
jgi:hypothetical protein